MIIPASQRVVELETVDFLKIAQGYDEVTIHDVRGIYNPNDGKIYLHSGHWCIKTAIHETLHACSIPSLSNFPKFRLLYEGLTELFTGYILYKERPNSYQLCWRAKEDRMCQNTYNETVRIWGAFCHFVPISETFRIYFHTGSDDLTRLQEKFVDRVSTITGKNFTNPFVSGGISAHSKFDDQCRKCLPRMKYNQIWNSRDLYTNFSTMKI